MSLITKNLNWEILTKNLVTFKRWDGVKDKKFWCASSLKIRFIEGESRQFADLRVEGLGKKGGVFEEGGGDTPMHTMNLAIILTVILIYWCQCPHC